MQATGNISTEVAGSRINVETAEYILYNSRSLTLDDIGKYNDTSEIKVITQDTLINNNGDTIATIEAAANNCNMGTVKFSNQSNQGLGSTNDAGSNVLEAGHSDVMMQATGMVLDDAGSNALEAGHGDAGSNAYEARHCGANGSIM